MTKKTILQGLLEETEYHPRSYSGRGMYGDECLAVVTDDLGELIASVMEYAIDTLDEDDMHTLAGSFRCMVSDAMGMDTVYYFPDLKFVPERPAIRTEAQVHGDYDGTGGAEAGVEFEEI